MNPKYTIKIIEKDSDNLIGKLVKSVRGWIGYFGVHENSYTNECREIDVVIVSNEEFKSGDLVVSDEDEYSVFKFDDNCPLTCYKYIGMAPQNILVDLISGIKKENGEVKISYSDYDFLGAPVISYDPQIGDDGAVYCY